MCAEIQERNKPFYFVYNSKMTDNQHRELYNKFTIIMARSKRAAIARMKEHRGYFWSGVFDNKFDAGIYTFGLEEIPLQDVTMKGVID